MTNEELNRLKEEIGRLNKEDLRKRDLYLRGLATGEIQGPPVGYPYIDKPWLKQYEKDDIHFDLPNKTVYEYVYDANQDNLENVALEYYGRKITYKEFFLRIAETEKAFRSIGIKKGDTVSFCVPSLPEIFYSFYALNKIGAIANMIDPRTNVSSIKKFIEDSGSSMLVYVDLAYPKMKKIISDLGISNVICVSPSDSLPIHLKMLLKMKSLITSKEKEIKSSKIMSWKQFIENGRSFSFQPETLENKLDLPSGIVYTSGTTGIPKGSVMNNGNFLSMVYQNHSAKMGWDKSDILLGIMPPFIAYGLVCGFTLPLCNGMQIDIIPKFDPESFDKYLLI